MIADNHIRHDPNLVASSIIELICDDLKYQDKQNDPQYLMLNTKLREEKRINKIKKDMAKKEKKAKKGKNVKIAEKKNTSKFSNKYSQRIASIREADEKARLKMEKEATKKIKKDAKTEKEDTKKVKKEIKERNKTTKIQTNKSAEKTAKMQTTKKVQKTTKPKSARGRKKTPQQIREEMIEELENSNLKNK